MVKIITVHGTNAADPSDTGDAWWQQGSQFEADIKKYLGDKSPDPIFLPFHWSGENSESGREEAAPKLKRIVMKLHRKGVQPVIIAHSHGGNVVARTVSSLANDVVSKVTVITIGTPFIRNELNLNPLNLLRNMASNFLIGKFGRVARLAREYFSRLWAEIGPVLAILPVLIVPYWVYELIEMGGASAGNWIAERGIWQAFFSSMIPGWIERISFGIQIFVVFLSIFAAYFMANITFNGIMGGPGHQPTAKSPIDYKIGSGARNWLSFWHEHDEAIAGLRKVLDINPRFVRANALVPLIEMVSTITASGASVIAILYFSDLATWKTICYAVAAFLGSFMIMFFLMYHTSAGAMAKSANKFVVSQLKNAATGDDIVGYQVFTIYAGYDNALQDPIAGEIQACSKRAVLRKYSELSSALAANTLGTIEDVDIGSALIHNQYFSSPLFVKFLVYCWYIDEHKLPPPGLEEAEEIYLFEYCRRRMKGWNQATVDGILGSLPPDIARKCSSTTSG